MDANTRRLAKDHLSAAMEALVERKCRAQPFNENEVYNRNPIGARLVPMEVWKGSSFERSFVTVLGQGIFEQLARIIAVGSGVAKAENQYTERLRIGTWRIEKIDQILKEQRTSKREPNWEVEIHEILSLTNDRFEDVTVVSDLFIQRMDGSKEYYSFKTVKPNLDQTELAKRAMLRLIAGNDNNRVFFALPYNPAGEGESYKKAKHSMPYKLFNMDLDPCVLIGARLWNQVGNDQGTFGELLSVFEEVGEIYSPIIRGEYLGLSE